jgi:hypothetical protein
MKIISQHYIRVGVFASFISHLLSSAAATTYAYLVDQIIFFLSTLID